MNIFMPISIFAICIAHFIRVLRWELFIKTYEKPDIKSLLQSLSIGFILNFFLPFKLGDLARAFIAGRKMKNGYGFSLATVIIDRILDIIVVGFVFAILYLINPNKIAASTSIIYIMMAIAIIIFAILIWYNRKLVKRSIKMIASIFNEKLEFKTLKFFWALIWGGMNLTKRINKWLLILYTVSMWCLYIVSYCCFAKFLSIQGEIYIQWVDLFYLLFSRNSIQVGNVKVLTEGLTFYSQVIWISIYLILPSLIVNIVSIYIKQSPNSEKYLNLIPHLNEYERLVFLESYFSGERSNYIQNYLKINQDILILRDYSAGSNATTMLCINNEKTFFRKYAIGVECNKLYEQIEWILKNYNILPLCEIEKYEKKDEYCYYDMVYDSNSIGMFEYAHSVPKEKAWLILKEVIQKLENSLYKTDLKLSDESTISLYIDTKVKKNIEKIVNSDCLKNIMGYENIIINGKQYKNLSWYFKFLTKEHLYEVFKNDTYSTIHGDLTIENIICRRNAIDENEWYIIDPNTGNIHESSNLDYGKLLQSIHGGYEFLVATKNVELNKNAINFTFIKSELYTYLFNSLDKYMNANFPYERIRSIYYHEIIHWLRLMPYKIDKNGKRVLIFYAGMLMVMSDVIDKFERQGIYENKTSNV